MVGGGRDGCGDVRPLELRHVDLVCLAGQVISARASFAAIAILLVLRAVFAALLPLSADEAYYWLWSKHLAAGYLDHPPAIAWLIAAGTSLFGDTPLGVRFAGLVLSLPATWFVWQGAAIILNDQRRAGTAALFFNLTLMASVELLAATPDMPSIVTSAGFVWALCKLQQTGNGRWWLAAGLAAGLGLLSKYSVLFLAAGTLLWLVVDARQRRWLSTPWPYLGALLAPLVAAPHLLWEWHHGFETFVFQFRRVGASHLTLRYLGEFLAAQFGLATPFIFILVCVGLWRGMRPGAATLVLAVLVWTASLYFAEHALHDRVQGNWPCFLYPALAILASDAFSTEGKLRWISLLAAPVAGLLLLLTYAQAQFELIALRKDPVARILGRDFAGVAQVAATMVRAHIATAIVTTDYETTAWLRFTQPGLKVIQVNEPERYPDAPAAQASDLKGTLLYLAEFRRDQHQLVQQQFAYTGFPTQLQTKGGGLYMLYPVSRPRMAQIGKMP
jgi:4-amino-4-deoxy-L-arabinose transferase-like glycosyltransferase